MKLVSERNQKKYEKFIRDFIPMRTATYLKFMGISDIKKMPEDDEWMMVSSAGVIGNGETVLIAHRYELASIDYINNDDQLITVDLTNDYGLAIKGEQLDELLDNAVILK